jgi:hypothetical protein
MRHVIGIATFIVAMLSAQYILYAFGMAWSKTIWAAFLVFVVWLIMDAVDDYLKDRYDQR